MPILQKAEVIIFKSMPADLSELTLNLFAGSSPSMVLLPLSTIEQFTEHTLQQWLHEDEMTRLAKFPYKKRHREWLGGRLCAKQALSTYLDQQPTSSCLHERHQFKIVATETGRPFFDQLEGMDLSLPAISISHSNDFAAAMTSRVHCGIDIQYTAENLHRVKERFCTQEEERLLQQLLSHFSSLLQLTFLWSGKEAVKKMLSPYGIPGFHELHLHEIKQLGQSCATMSFIKNDNFLSIFEVAVGIYDTHYALALCCQQEKSPFPITDKRTQNA